MTVNSAIKTHAQRGSVRRWLESGGAGAGGVVSIGVFKVSSRRWSVGLS
jgi:hypothetical protein